jgi:RsiW-degrading membrane proteinase PrsW (M82 family)
VGDVVPGDGPARDGPVKVVVRPATTREASAAAEPSGDRWPGKRLALLFIGVLVVTLVNALQALDAFVRFQATLPPPPLGTWAHPEPIEAALFSANALLLSFAAALPALWVLRRAGRSNGVPLERLLTALFVGAIVLGMLGGQLPPLVRAVTGIEPPDGTSTNATTAFLAPVLEELLLLASTAIVLLVGRPRRGLRVGLLLGAAVGLGMNVGETVVPFAATELFADSAASAVPTVAIRFGLLGLSLHVTTAAVSGAGLGAWLARGGRLRGLGFVLGGLLLAIVVHSAWNLFATDAINALLQAMSRNVDPFAPPMLFLASSVTAVPFLVVPWVALAVAWRRSGCTPASADGVSLPPGTVSEPGLAVSSGARAGNASSAPPSDGAYPPIHPPTGLPPSTI